MTILIDPGHGNNTAGKRSPDGSFLEYSFNREIAHRLCCAINSLPSLNSLTSPTSLSLSALVIVPELEDIPLRKRCNRVNEICRTIGTENVLLISIHANAAGNGSQWCKTTGWSCYTSPGNTKADALADALYAAARKSFPTRRIRTDYSDGDADWEENFFVLKHTLCPAVLTENFFYDSHEDLAYLTSEEGKKAIVQCHIDGILSFLTL